VLTEILELPLSTPYIPLLMETGFWPMRDRIAYKKLMLYQNIIKSDNKRVVKKIVKEQIKMERKTPVEKELLIYNIQLNPEEITKSRWKKNVKKAISKKL
jgi:hypothetical protein